MTSIRPGEPRRATSASGRQVALDNDCAGDRVGGAQHADPLRLVLEELDRADVLEVDRRDLGFRRLELSVEAEPGFDLLMLAACK